MKISLEALSRRTGYTHQMVDKPIEKMLLQMQPNGSIDLSFDTDGMQLSGHYKARVSLPLSELYAILGKIEERKLRKLLSIEDELGRLDE